MRIIHDVTAPMSSSAGIQGGAAPRANLFACTDSRRNHPDLPDYIWAGEPDELIEIEGDLEYIDQMVTAWYNAIQHCKARMAGPLEGELEGSSK